MSSHAVGVDVGCEDGPVEAIDDGAAVTVFGQTPHVTGQFLRAWTPPSAFEVQNILTATHGAVSAPTTPDSRLSTQCEVGAYVGSAVVGVAVVGRAVVVEAVGLVGAAVCVALVGLPLTCPGHV